MAKVLDARKALRDAFERAHRNYRRIAEELEARLQNLQAALLGEPEPAKALMEAVVAHDRALGRVLDYEVKLFKRRPGGVVGGPTLDLDAARREIAGRLARLADDVAAR